MCFQTHSTLVASGMSAAAGALSSPMLEQLTTQDGRGPDSTQLQLSGHGVQPCVPEPQTSTQHSATRTLENRPNPGTQTPCFRLDKVCPFPQGIAYSHRIASAGVSPLKVGRNKHTGQKSSGFSCEETNRRKPLNAPFVVFFQITYPTRGSFFWKYNGTSPRLFFSRKKSSGELPLSSPSHCRQFSRPPLGGSLSRFLSSSFQSSMHTERILGYIQIYQCVVLLTIWSRGLCLSADFPLNLF